MLTRLFILLLIFSLSLAADDSPQIVKPDSLKGPVFELDKKGLYAVAEAENCVSDKKAWVLTDEKDQVASSYWSKNGIKYTGKGFVIYNGPKRIGHAYIEDKSP